MVVPAGSQTLIVGILGGWQKYDSPRRAVRKLALRMRELRLPGVEIETFENHHPEAPLEKVKAWWAASDANRNVIVYG